MMEHTPRSRLEAAGPRILMAASLVTFVIATVALIAMAANPS